ncbi:lipase member K-like isoform X2 [Agrilus planipennis]|uniref:Lipase member K-like isoform X2 n=1 Tax=Agrilus planipennis TaxID=224129 RepID=A0A1W4WGS0_AGRPL|nr:lipase member K-like isoform X2 [Agrilus planipennis]
MHRCCLITLLCLQLELQSCAFGYYRQKTRNNVCKNFKDYNYIDTSPNCWYNPDVDATVPEMINRNNYPVERYQVATADGYILTLFRIPKKESNKGVVYLQHPLTAAANVWVDKGNKSLAFLLSDAGYDVWMGHFRGTIYSSKHLRLPTTSNAYWNHSFHEMGMYDLPAQIDLVKKYSHTSDKIYYVGHSMGTTAAFIYNALLPKHAEKNIKVFVEMAPTAFLGNSNILMQHIAFLRQPIVDICEQFNFMNLFNHNGFFHNFAKGMGPNYGNQMPVS